LLNLTQPNPTLPVLLPDLLLKTLHFPHKYSKAIADKDTRFLLEFRSVLLDHYACTWYRKHMWVVHRVVSSGWAWLTLCPTSPASPKLKCLKWTASCT